VLSLTDFIRQTKEALGKNSSVIFNCQCSIIYSGRAESHLPLGDRTIIIKSDKTLLVHQPTGNNPINYMKEKTNHTLSSSGNSVVLQSVNFSLKEFMDIQISKVYFLHTQHLKDSEKIILIGTERDMAEHIMKHPELIGKDFKPLNLEEHTKYGFIDVFGHDKNNVLVVIECKRYTGNLDAVTQLRRYVEKIKTSKGLDKVRGILACPGISQNALIMLKDWGYEYCQVSPPKYMEKYDKQQQKLI